MFAGCCLMIAVGCLCPLCVIVCRSVCVVRCSLRVSCWLLSGVVRLLRVVPIGLYVDCCVLCVVGYFVSC